MSTFPQQRSKLAKSLLNELTFLLENIDNKKSNFFISALISSVLRYHLAWVPTVAPMTGFEERNGKNLFYDPLWAQLGDLYGSIGTLSTMSRTIIVGEDANTVRRILFVLSYFIRCNEVYERMEHMIPVESQFEELKKVHVKISSPEDAPETLFSPSSIIEPESLNKKAGSKNDSNVCKTKSLDANNFQQTAESQRRNGNVNSDLSFVDNSTINLLEVPMPRSQNPVIVPDVSSKETCNENSEPPSKNLPYQADELFVKSYGRSLMVGYCDTYMSDFVLMGLPKLNEPQQESLDADLKNSLLMQPLSSHDPISKSVCILGNLDRLNCSVLGYRTAPAGHIFSPLYTSDYICTMLHQCKDLYTIMGMSAESCLEYIEDHLRILYYKAVMYNKLFASTPTNATGTPLSIASQSIYMPPSPDDVPLDILDAIGLQESDIPLVKAIKSTF